jgi:hypothetical protein
VITSPASLKSDGAAVSCPLSAISYRLSAVSYQNLATSAARTARGEPGEMFVLLSALTK